MRTIKSDSALVGLEANFKYRPDQSLYPPAICKLTCGMVLHLIRSCTMRVLFAIKFSKILSWNMCRRLHEAGHHFFLCKHVQCKAAQFLMYAAYKYTAATQT